MNEQLAKKLGEVQAFAELGLLLLERSGTTGKAAFGQELTERIREALATQKQEVEGLADQTKAARTVAKVGALMDQYIGDQWDNPIEILEWSGFYFGAAGIHWSLIAGLLAKQDTATGLLNFSNEQAHLFAQWHEMASERIKVL